MHTLAQIRLRTSFESSPASVKGKCCKISKFQGDLLIDDKAAISGKDEPRWFHALFTAAHNAWIDDSELTSNQAWFKNNLFIKVNRDTFYIKINYKITKHVSHMM